MLVLHILSFGFVLGVTAIADKDAFAWIRGKKQTLDAALMHQYHVMIWAGLIALIVSGTILFYPMRVFLLQDLLFDVKLLFVGILLVNGVLIGRLLHVALEKPFAELTGYEKRALFASGAISALSWVCAAGIALLIF